MSFSFDAAFGDTSAVSFSPFPRFRMNLLLKRFFRAGLIIQAGVGLLLSSCSQNQQAQPAPNNVAIQANSSELQQLFSQKQYAQKLPQALGGANKFEWEPQWNATRWQNSADSVRYAYVPLEAKALGGKPMTMLGVKQYIRFRQTPKLLDAALVSYYYTLPKGGITGADAVSVSALNRFTGTMLVRELATDQLRSFRYKEGKWQQPASTITSRSSIAAAANDGCEDVWYCYWELKCPTEYGGGPPYVIALTGPSCDENQARGVTLACGYATTYTLQQSYSVRTCPGGNPPTDPNNPYPGTPGTPEDGTPAPVPQTSDAIISGGAYVLRPSHNLGQIVSMDWYKASGNYDNPVDQTVPGSRPDQFWYITDVGDGYFKLTSSFSGMCLGIFNLSTYNGERATASIYNGSYTQHWKFILQPNGLYNIVNRLSYKSLEISGGSTAPGANAGQYDYYGLSHQQWLVYTYTRLP